MNKVTAVTHDGSFHPDDVFAAACLSIIYEDYDLDITRTRDESIIDSAQIVFDVGMKYDPETFRFDHHQQEGAGTRQNGLPYSSFGLIWKHLGDKVCPDKKVRDEIDFRLVSVIDALDNGINITLKAMPHYPDDFTIFEVVKLMKPTWKYASPETFDRGFKEAMSLAEHLLRRLIEKVEADIEAEEYVTEAYKRSEDKRVVILDVYVPWAEALSKFTEPLLVVYPNLNGTYWNVEVVRDDPSNFKTNRIEFPRAWAGLRDEELTDVSGVEGAVFTHKNLFLSIADSKEGAFTMVNKALLKDSR